MNTIDSPLIYLASQSPRRQELLNQIDIPFQMLLPDEDEDVEALEIALVNEDPADYVQRVSQLKARAACARWHRRAACAPPSSSLTAPLSPAPDIHLNARLARAPRVALNATSNSFANTTFNPPTNDADKLLPLPILCADTTVAYNGKIFGKPRDRDEAQHMLMSLSGATHQVLSAVSISTPTHADKIYTILSTSSVEFGLLEKDEITAYIASGEPFGKAGAYAIQGRAALFIKHITGSYSGIMGLPLFETAALLAKLGVKPPFPIRPIER